MSATTAANHDRRPAPTTAARRARTSRCCSPRTRSPPCAAGCADAPARSRDLENCGSRAAVVAGHDDLAERAARAHPQGGARADRHAQGGGRPARPAAVRLTARPRVARRRHGRHPHRRPQDAGRRQPVGRPRRPAPRARRSCSTRRSTSSPRCGYERVGEVVMLKELLGDGDRVLVVAHADEERVCRLAESAARRQPLRVGDALMLDPRSGFVYERIPKAEVEDLVLEEVPDIAYEDIGGLAGQIEQIRDAVELPYLHPDLFKEHQLQAAEGRAALRPARLRQDADRQGGRRVAGQEGRRAKPAQADGQVLLPQHQGPRAAQQVRRRDRAAHPADLPAGPREGLRRHPGRGVLRRDGLAVPHPRVRACPPTSRRRSCRSCSARSTASSGWRTSSSSAPPTART